MRCSRLGFSNSGEIDRIEYKRELEDPYIDLSSLIAIIELYTSAATLRRSGTSRYAQHKRQIESIIAESVNDFIILRLPQVVGVTANRTLINYFVSAARNKKQNSNSKKRL